MKKGLKFLTGAIAAVTLLSSALVLTTSAKSPVYTAGNIFKAPANNYIWGTNTEIYPSFDNCLSYIFSDCNTNQYWWWNDKYSSYRDYVNLTEVTVSTVISDEENTAKKTATLNSKIPWAAVKKGTTGIAETSNNTTDSDDCVIYNPCILYGGKYYSCKDFNISKFFKNNTYDLSMYKGQVQFMNTGYKMYSSNSNVILCYTDGNDQILKAVGTGNAYVYFYTNGGVPFLRLSITVKSNGNTKLDCTSVVDITPDKWNLSKIGESTTLSVFAPKEYSKDIQLKVVYGKASIDGNTVTAKSNGAIVLYAYSKSNPSVCGYAVLYVGQYTSSIIAGSWKPVSSGICGNYWNTNLWFNDNYVICGWVEVNGIYIPVIKEYNSTITKPNPGHPNFPSWTPPSCGNGTQKPTFKVYTLRELINMCRGDLNIVLKVIEVYKENGITYYDEMYTDIVNNMIKDLDLSDFYFYQLH